MSDLLKKALKMADLSEGATAAMNAALAELDKAKGELGEYYDPIMQAISYAMSGDMAKMGEMEEEKQAAEAEAAELKTAGEAALKALDKDEPEVGAASDSLAKALGTERKIKHEDDLPPHLKAQLDEAKTKAEQQGERIAKMEREAEVSKAVATAEKNYGHVPMDPKEIAKTLVAADADTRKALEEMLGKVNGTMEKAFAELGTTGGDDGTGAVSKMAAKAVEIQKAASAAGKPITIQKARVQARNENPDLAKQEREERGQ